MASKHFNPVADLINLFLITGFMYDISLILLVGDKHNVKLSRSAVVLVALINSANLLLLQRSNKADILEYCFPLNNS